MKAKRVRDEQGNRTKTVHRDVMDQFHPFHRKDQEIQQTEINFFKEIVHNN